MGFPTWLFGEDAADFFEGAFAGARMLGCGIAFEPESEPRYEAVKALNELDRAGVGQFAAMAVQFESARHPLVIMTSILLITLLLVPTGYLLIERRRAGRAALAERKLADRASSS